MGRTGGQQTRVAFSVLRHRRQERPRITLKQKQTELESAGHAEEGWEAEVGISRWLKIK